MKIFLLGSSSFQVLWGALDCIPLTDSEQDLNRLTEQGDEPLIVLVEQQVYQRLDREQLKNSQALWVPLPNGERRQDDGSTEVD